MLKLVDRFRQKFSKSSSDVNSAEELPNQQSDNQAAAKASSKSEQASMNCHVVIEPHLFVERGFESLQCQVFLSQDGSVPDSDSFTTFSTPELTYEPFCDDFGPMNMLCVMKFIDILDQEIIGSKQHSRKMVYCPKKGTRNLTNAAFLLGSYMVLKLDCDPEYVSKCFKAFGTSAFEGYRDATYSFADFRLRLVDCWSGLYRGKQKGWIALPSPSSPSLWGKIDAEEYERYDNYLNGDLHTVVPDRFVAFKGPKEISDRKYKDIYRDGKFYSRDFSPTYYAEIFEDIGVGAVARLNDICYQRRDFTASSIAHHDLFFEDCTSPPSDIVGRFFDIVDSTKGMVAIHCKAGLGRTGTLIALALIRSDGFTAREAIGWLRIMRPGSVIGEQQGFLCCVEECVYGRKDAPAPAAHAAAGGAGSCSSADSRHTPAAARDPAPPRRIRSQKCAASLTPELCAAAAPPHAQPPALGLTMDDRDLFTSPALLQQPPRRAASGAAGSGASTGSAAAAAAERSPISGGAPRLASMAPAPLLSIAAPRHADAAAAAALGAFPASAAAGSSKAGGGSSAAAGVAAARAGMIGRAPGVGVATAAGSSKFKTSLQDLMGPGGLGGGRDSSPAVLADQVATAMDRRGAARALRRM